MIDLKFHFWRLKFCEELASTCFPIPEKERCCMGVLAQVKEMEQVMLQKVRCSHYYFGHTGETWWISTRNSDVFGRLLVGRELHRNSKLCEVDWEWKSVKYITLQGSF